MLLPYITGVVGKHNDNSDSVVEYNWFSIFKLVSELVSDSVSVVDWFINLFNILILVSDVVYNEETFISSFVYIYIQILLYH